MLFMHRAYGDWRQKLNVLKKIDISGGQAFQNNNISLRVEDQFIFEFLMKQK